jgi:uncharacterized membrane protein (DUF4010 family)
MGEKRASPFSILAVVGFGIFIAADDLTVVSTMLRPIIGDLGIILSESSFRMASMMRPGSSTLT